MSDKQQLTPQSSDSGSLMVGIGGLGKTALERIRQELLRQNGGAETRPEAKDRCPGHGTD